MNAKESKLTRANALCQQKGNGYCGKHNPEKKVVKEEVVPDEVKPKVKAAPKKKVVKAESEEEEEEAKPKVKASPKKKVVKAESEEEEEAKPKVKSPPKKKVVEQECNFTSPTTHAKCSHSGTVKPEGAAFHYCKRHSEKSAEIEKNLDEEIEEEIEEEDEEEVVHDNHEFE